MPVDLPDWTTSVSAGGSQVWSANQAVASGVTLNGPVLDVSAFTELLLNIGTTAGNNVGTVQLVWYQDAAGTKQLHFGQAFRKATAVFTSAVIPVLGPYLQVLYINSAGGVANLQANIEGFSTPFKLCSADVLGIDTLLALHGVSEGASATVNPAVMAPGKIRYWLQDNAVAGQVWLFQYWDGAAWQFFGSVVGGAAASPSVGELEMPLSDWRVQFQTITTAVFVALIAER